MSAHTIKSIISLKKRKALNKNKIKKKLEKCKAATQKETVESSVMMFVILQGHGFLFIASLDLLSTNISVLHHVHQEKGSRTRPTIGGNHHFYLNTH